MKKDRNEIITKGLKKISVYDWMYRELGLKGDELMVYAAFYGAGDRRLFLSDSPLVYEYMKMDRSTFFRVRARLMEKRLLEITEEDCVKYYYVPKPDFTLPATYARELTETRSESVVEIENETPDLPPAEKPDGKSSDALGMRSSETIAQLDLLGMLQRPAGTTSENLDNPEKTGEAVTANEPGESSVDNPSPAAGDGEKTPKMIPVAEEKKPDPERKDDEKAKGGHMTKEEFCEKMQVEYDGTENTQGMDWDVLYKAYSESEYLRNLKKAHILKYIPFNYEGIKSGKYSDERRAEMAKGKEPGDESNSPE